MPHVDDGTLHALIDGALRADEPDRAAEVERHLAGCEDCRARLESARELHHHASGILDDALPAGLAASADIAASADFDDVRERARGSAGSGAAPRAGAADDRVGPTRRHADVRRTLGWTRTLTWAATLVIALGTGYLLRDLVGPTGAVGPAGDAASDRAAEVTRGDGDGATPDAEDATAESDRPPAPVATPAPPRPAPEPGAEPQQRAPDPAEASRRPAEEVRARDVAAAESAADLAGGERILLRRAEGDPAARPAATPTAGAREPATAPAPAPAPAGAPPGMADRPGERWAATDVAGARVALDGPLYLLPRARLLEVYISEDATEPTVLTLQRLESGIPVRVVQRRPPDPGAAGAADAAAEVREEADAPDTLPGTEVARITRGPFTLEVEGTLPAELLAILAESARPAP